MNMNIREVERRVDAAADIPRVFEALTPVPAAVTDLFEVGRIAWCAMHREEQWLLFKREGEKPLHGTVHLGYVVVPEAWLGCAFDALPRFLSRPGAPEITFRRQVSGACVVLGWDYRDGTAEDDELVADALDVVATYAPLARVAAVMREASDAGR